MLNFHIIKVDLKNGEVRYRTILTQSGKGIKTKTFRRKQDARTWGNRAVLDSQEYEAKGKRPLSPPMLNARNDRSLDFLMRKSDGVIDGLDQSYRSMAA